MQDKVNFGVAKYARLVWEEMFGGATKGENEVTEVRKERRKGTLRRQKHRNQSEYK